MATQQTAKTLFVTAKNTTFAYRRFGAAEALKLPLLLLTHFRGTMDYWDPTVVNGLAATREVILFDNAGCGLSSGPVDDSIPKMATHVTDFLSALDIHKLDVLGFSMGGFIAPLVHLNGPKGLVDHLVISGSGPSASEGVLPNPPERQKFVGEHALKTHLNVSDWQDIFFSPSKEGKAAGAAWYHRMMERQPSTSGEKRTQLVDLAGTANQSIAISRWNNETYRAEGDFDRLKDIHIPVLITQGSDDIMIPTVNSFVMQQKLPNGRLKIYPDSSHAAQYQYPEEYVRDVVGFLDGKKEV